jgi:hypothetical protein
MPSRSELGIQPLTVGLVGTQLVLLASTLPMYRIFGLTLVWRSAVPIVVTLAGLLAGWGYYASTRTTAFERGLAEVLLIVALLVSFAAIAIPGQYAAAALARPIIDPLLARADELLGIHVPSLAAWTRGHPRVNGVLAWAYFTLLRQLALTAPLLAILRERRALWEFVFHFHVCAVITLLAFALFPAACAFSYYGFESTIPQARFIAHFAGARDGTMRVLEYGRMEGLVSMPSFHVAGALMVTWAFRRRIWLLVPLVALNGLLVIATVMTGAHYVIDMVGTLAMFAGSLVLWRRWGGALWEDSASRP